MKRIGVWALACVVAPAVYAGAGNIPGHGEGGPGDQETEQLGGLRFYVGATYDWVQLHIANSPLEHYNLQFADMRVGYRLFKSIGLEFHAGAPTQSTDGIAGRARLNHDYGFFIVPSTVVFDTFEISFPIGYNIFGATAVNPGPVGAKGDVDSISFGGNVEFPIRVIDGGLPDVRIVAGGMMLSTHASQQIYGFRAGLRYDFAFNTAPPPAETPAGENESSGGGTPAPEGGAAAPASGGSSGAAAPASGSSAGSSAPASGSSAGSAAPASGSSAGSSAPASGASAGASAPASGGSSGGSAPASGSSGSGSAPAAGSSSSSSAPASGSSSAAPASGSSTGAAKPAP